MYTFIDNNNVILLMKSKDKTQRQQQKSRPRQHFSAAHATYTHHRHCIHTFYIDHGEYGIE